MAEQASFGGCVIAGAGRGRTIGVPTANVRVDDEGGGLLEGVYRATVRLNDDNTAHVAVVNIGRRPTVEEEGAVSIEAHILDFDADLYGQRLTVHLRERLREERRFDSIEELQQQIRQDIEMARRQAAQDGS